MNRRDFEKLAAAFLLSNTLHGRVSAGAGSAPTPRFSVMAATLENATHLPFERCLEIISSAGYRGVELNHQIPTWSPADMQRERTRLSSLNLVVDAIGGIKSGFADPAGPGAMLVELSAKIEAARVFGCDKIILLSGPRAETLPREQQHRIALDNLKRIAEYLETTPITGVIEPIDGIERPGNYLTSIVEAFDLARATGSAHLRVLYDFYHEARTAPNESLAATLDGNIDLVGLVHIADNPGRHQPGTGTIDIPAIYRKLGELKYKNFIAMEFSPTGDPVAVLREARLQAQQGLAQGRTSRT